MTNRIAVSGFMGLLIILFTLFNAEELIQTALYGWQPRIQTTAEALSAGSQLQIIFMALTYVLWPHVKEFVEQIRRMFQ